MASIMAKTIIFSVFLVFITSTLSNASSYRTYNGDQDTPVEPTYTYNYQPVQEYTPTPKKSYYRPVQQYSPTTTQPSNTYQQDGPYYTQPQYTYQDKPYYYYTQPPASPTYDYKPPVVYTQPPPTPTYDYKPPAIYSQPPPSPIYSGGGASGSDKESFLRVHNVARAALGIAPLVWDDVVASYAQNWANQRINDCRLVHSDGPYGENIFWGSGSYSAAFAVQSWVNERKYYDYSTNSCRGGMDCGHYTQIVWKKSTHLGCARVTCNNGGVFVTCNYNPPGNYIGIRPY